MVRDPKKRRPLNNSAALTSESPGAGGGEEDDDGINGDDDLNFQVEGVGSGFVWDKSGHIVSISLTLHYFESYCSPADQCACYIARNEASISYIQRFSESSLELLLQTFPLFSPFRSG